MCEHGVLRHVVVGPNSKLRIAWDALSVFAVGYDVLTVPLIAFGQLDSPLALWAGMATTLFWTIDIPFTFISGFHVGGIVEMRLRQIALNYARHWFFLDLFIILTDWALVFLQSGLADVVGLVRISKTLRLSRILRLFRLLRVIKLPALSEDISGNLQSEFVLTVLGVLRSLAIIAVVNHFIACGWYAVGNSVLPSWVELMDEESRDVRYRYATALHWSLTQFTPASMEIVPRNFYERLFAIVVLFSALITFSTFVSSITTAMTNLRRINLEKSKQRDNIRKYVADNRISLELGNRITAFLRTNNFLAKRRVHEEDVQVFKVLPEPIRLQLHWEVYSPKLLPHPFFHQLSELDEPGLVELCHLAMGEQHVTAGHELFTYGKPCAKMYIVLAGVLEYHNSQRDQTPWSVPEGHFLCEAALWVRWEHRGRAVAVTPCEFAAMDSHRFRTVISHRPQVLGACREYAQEFFKRLYSWHQADLGCEFDENQELAHHAFEHASENEELRPAQNPRTNVQKLWRSWSPGDFVKEAAKSLGIVTRRSNSA